MGAIYDEFVRELAEVGQEHAGDPQGERLHLFLLALEREQIVSVAYREELIEQRLSTLDVPADVRELIRHALLWAWKDEEMHAVFVRGAILRLGGTLLRLRAFSEQMAGAIGGWAASVRHHLPWRRAPLSNAAAWALTAAGRVVGRVPSAVAPTLEYATFREFCRLNVDAEDTAALCWKRLCDLGLSETGLPASLTEELAQMKDDEDRHGRVFQVLAAAFDEQDRLRPGHDAESLARALGEIGPFFLAAERRPEPLRTNVGAGGVVFVRRDRTAGGDKRAALRAMLRDLDLAGLVARRAEQRGLAPASLRAAVKPTFMIGYDRRDTAPITDPELVGELVAALEDCGVGEVALVESPTIYDRFFGGRSVAEVARYFGYDTLGARVVDAGAEQVPHDYARGMALQTVSRTWKEAHLRVSFAKMRANAVDMATLTVANLEGLGPRHDEFFFAERHVHRDTALMMVLAEFPPDLALIDAWNSASDGMLGMMGCPRPRRPHRLYGGLDPAAVDTVALRHMGIDDPDRSTMLRAARHWFGDVRSRIRVEGIDAPIEGWRSPVGSGLASLLSLLAYPVYQFASGRGSLFVPQMDETAFPPLAPPSLTVRVGRRAIQTMFGLSLR